MISSIAIFAGIVLLLVGIWLIRISSDPLGYSPPAVYWVATVGLWLILLGAAAKALP